MVPTSHLRIAKLGGIAYELVKAGSRELKLAAQEINHSVGYKSKRYHVEYDAYITSRYRHTDAGAPARIKTATAAQIAVWPELERFRRSQEPVFLLWKRIDAAPVVL